MRDVTGRKMGAGPRWLRSFWLLPLLCVAAMLPMIFPHYIATNDLAGHIGRYALELDDGRSADLARWYSYRWDFIPNLGVDMLMLVIGRWLPFFTAVKVALLSIPVAHVLGLGLTSRVVHGRVTPHAIFALPLVFGFFFGFGFANFCLGLGGAFGGFALWRHLGDRGWLGVRALLFAGISTVAWMVHMDGWALLCVLCGADELVRRLSVGGARIRALAIVALNLIVLLAPLIIKHFTAGPGGPAGPAGMGEVIRNFFDWENKGGVFAFVLRDRWMVWDLGGMLLLVGLYVWGARSRKFAFDPALLLATILLAVLYIALPYEMADTAYVDTRLAPMLFMTALVSLRPTQAMSARAVNALAIAALAFTGARFVGNAISLKAWDAQFRKDLATLDAVPRGASMVTLTAMPCGPDIPWNRDRRGHLSGLAIPLRHVFDNNLFASASGQLVRAHNAEAGIFRDSPSGEGRTHDCYAGSGQDWRHKLPLIPPAIRYLWRVGIARGEPIPGWALIRDSGTVQLYRR